MQKFGKVQHFMPVFPIYHVQESFMTYYCFRMFNAAVCQNVNKQAVSIFARPKTDKMSLKVIQNELIIRNMVS